jgi:hypothetical protein
MPSASVSHISQMATYAIPHISILEVIAGGMLSTRFVPVDIPTSRKPECIPNTKVADYHKHSSVSRCLYLPAGTISEPLTSTTKELRSASIMLDQRGRTVRVQYTRPLGDSVYLPVTKRYDVRLSSIPISPHFMNLGGFFRSKGFQWSLCLFLSRQLRLSSRSADDPQDPLVVLVAHTRSDLGEGDEPDNQL